MSTLTKLHIEQLVIHFYQQVQKDELLGPIFNDLAKVDWEHHIPLLCQFWNSIMLKTHEYRGNAYAKHVFLSENTPIKEIHFTRWLELFEKETHKHLPAEDAKTILERAKLIGESLKYGMKITVHC